MRILFMGTPEFAVPCLEVLLKSKHEVVGAVTQPDKPVGRGHKLTPPPVKACAVENNIEVFQPDTLKDFAFKGELERLNPDLIIVVAYGKILPEYVLNYPKLGCINIHASLLPKYRGAGPIQWAVVNGEKKTGITSMLMEKGLDTGDILLKCETEIGEYETADELHDRLMIMGAKLLEETVECVENGTLKPEKQNDEESTYAPMISKETAKIDWSKSSKEIICLVCGMNSWPVAHSMYEGATLKIYRAIIGRPSKGNVGEIIRADENGMEIVCGDGCSVIATEIQVQGSKKMNVRDYLNGHKITVGEILC